MTGPLDGLHVIELDAGTACKFAARLFADLGADVVRFEDEHVGDRDLHAALNLGKRIVRTPGNPQGYAATAERLIDDADLLITGTRPDGGFPLDRRPEAYRRAGNRLCVTSITPFGLTGPRAGYRGGDLTVFHSSAVARYLLGQVQDPERTPPVRASGEQTAFVAGMTAALASMAAVYLARSGGGGRVVDVSMQQAMLSLIPAQLAQHAFGEGVATRARILDGGGSTVCVLPVHDGYIAISPREEHQWASWLNVMGNPDWGTDSRFTDRAGRAANWDALFELMRGWSVGLRKDEIVAAAQQAHVPCLPWELPDAHLTSAQLQHRGFWRKVDVPGEGRLRLSGSPFGFQGASSGASSIEEVAGEPAWRTPRSVARPTERPSLPLKGVRIVDLGWVIAGPACTRYLAALGADVIKVEPPGRPDPGRAGRLHEVLGQSKRAVTLDLKSPGDAGRLRALIAEGDILVENFAHGVMDRLGLGRAALAELNPNLIQVSSSGMGRTGPQAGAVAYGTLLQAYTGFSALNGYPGQAPAIGMAWTDFVCGLALAFGSLALLDQRRRTGLVEHIDLSMFETQLMTMPGPIIQGQRRTGSPGPAGNEHATRAPHNVYRCAGDDRWLAIEVTSDAQWKSLCNSIGGRPEWETWGEPERRANVGKIDEAIGNWARERRDLDAMSELQASGVPASASLTVADIYRDPHLKERGFFVEFNDGRTPELPGMPWSWDGPAFELVRAPDAGEHNGLAGWRGS